MDLTKRQQEIFDFIKRYSAQARLPADRARHRQGRRARVVLDGARAPGEPRADRAARAAIRPSRGRSSCSTARLARCGQVRSIVRPMACRLLGSVAAGPADARRGEHRGVRRRRRRPPAATTGEYLLRVRGESMKNVGIIEGDLVVVRPQDTAQDGEIVVALVGEEATVKRFFREADHVRLQPENDDDGADPQPRGPGARPRGRIAEEPLMGATVLPRRPRRLSGLLGREVRRPVDHERPGTHRSIHSREGRVGRQVDGVESAVCGEAPGAPTLDDLIAGVWEELSVSGLVRCPVCGEKMASLGGGIGAPHGDCVDCGTRLH